MITVYNFLQLYTTDDEIEIYDLVTEQAIFHGYKDDLDYDIEELEVMSFDIESNGLIIINVETNGDFYSDTRIDETCDEEYDDEPYCPSSTNRDYSPSNPWDAPGMSIRDFI